MVGAGRFELPTPGPPDRCANRAALRSEAVLPVRLHIHGAASETRHQVEGLWLLLGGGKDPATGLDLFENAAQSFDFKALRSRISWPM